MKQTAVEWLIEQLECFGNKHELQMSWATVNDLVEQAKAMEREEILQFAIKAVSSAVNEDINAPYNLEQLYNETYGE